MPATRQCEILAGRGTHRSQLVPSIFLAFLLVTHYPSSGLITGCLLLPVTSAPMRWPEALGPGSGASRRWQPSAGLHFRRRTRSAPRRRGSAPECASAARPTRSRSGSPSQPRRGRPRASAGSGPCGRHSGPPAPCARESPSLSPVRGRCL